MLQSKLFYKTIKNKSSDGGSVSHDLLTRAGYVDQLMAGVYSFLPLGFLVLGKIEKIIREEMQKIGGQEILMPVLQPKENWQKTGRWSSLEILFKLKGGGDKEYALGPTHEEVVSPLAKRFVFSYRDLPFSVFQIQEKFRDELRAKSGILRTREFLMKDLYSFHSNQADLDRYYEDAAKSYEIIFKRCGILNSTYRTLAGGGSFSKYSDEFQTVTEAGEDVIYICRGCRLAINKEIKSENPLCPVCKKSDFDEKKSIEVGNIFKLGTNFSKPFDLKFTDRDANDKLVLMGCYGIGLTRLMAAAVEASHDDKGIIWPKTLSPYLAHLIKIENKPKVNAMAQKIYDDLSLQKNNDVPTKTLQKHNIEVLYDDRQDKSAGEKFAESDLIGIPWRIVVSEKTLAKKEVEIKSRDSGKVEMVKIKKLNDFFN